MSTDYLYRSDAPFGALILQLIDNTVISAATSQMTARRLLEVEGPYGLGLKSIAGPDDPLEGDGGDAVMSTSPSIPVATIRTNFALLVRDIANAQQTGVDFDRSPAATAAINCARQEDDLIFNGSKKLGIPGLLSTSGAATVKLDDWSKVGAAFDNMLAAVASLDETGFYGPYTLGLAPSLYNLLLRKYPQGSTTEMQHLQQLITGGIIKSPAIAEGGVLLAVGRQYASIVLGQDLATGFVGPTEDSLEFFVIESLTVRVNRPEAVCRIAP